MKNKRIILIVTAVVVVTVAAALVVLSQLSGMPPVHKVEQTIQDDHIPR